MMTFENATTEISEEIDIALSIQALFDQYDDALPNEAANDDDYDNLYPYIG